MGKNYASRNFNDAHMVVNQQPTLDAGQTITTT